METLDYLAIGHVTRDLLPNGGTTYGGAVTYSAQAASALGCRAGVITSVASESDSAEAFQAAGEGNIQVHFVPAEQTTTFENIYRPGGRRQIIHAVAGPIGVRDIPAGWDRAAIVHIAPVAREVDPDMISRFSNSLVGITPQGWMRRWDSEGSVSATDWAQAQQYFPLAAAVIVSAEDLVDQAMLDLFRQWAVLLVMTDGPNGCVVFMGDEVRESPAPAVQAVELTGAGDIFATAFLLRLEQTRGNPWEAARYANEVAAQAVTYASLQEKIGFLQRLGRQQVVHYEFASDHESIDNH